MENFNKPVLLSKREMQLIASFFSVGKEWLPACQKQWNLGILIKLPGSFFYCFAPPDPALITGILPLFLLEKTIFCWVNINFHMFEIHKIPS
jgi:hypothetical protein